MERAALVVLAAEAEADWVSRVLLSRARKSAVCLRVSSAAMRAEVCSARDRKREAIVVVFVVPTSCVDVVAPKMRQDRHFLPASLCPKARKGTMSPGLFPASVARRAELLLRLI